MKLDRNYELVGETYNWVLKYKSDPKTNDKGKEYHTTNEWYYPKIEMALKKYLDESLKPCDTIQEVLEKIDLLKYQFTKSPINL